MKRWAKGARTAPVLVAVTVVAGCGGSSSSSSTVSKADYAAKATGICNKINDRIAALPKIGSAQDLLSTGPKEIAIAKQGVAELGALNPPDAQKAAVAKYVSALQQETSLSSQLIAAFKARDANQLRKVEAEVKTNQAQDHADATSLGLTACAKQVQPSG